MNWWLDRRHFNKKAKITAQFVFTDPVCSRVKRRHYPYFKPEHICTTTTLLGIKCKCRDAYYLSSLLISKNNINPMICRFSDTALFGTAYFQLFHKFKSKFCQTDSFCSSLSVQLLLKMN
jgi:hypothetical protein